MGNLIENTILRTILIDDCGDVTVIENTVNSTIVLEDSNAIVEEQITTPIVLETTDREIITVAEQGPRGVEGPPGPPGGLLQVDSSDIPVSSTVVVDAFSITTYRSVKWLMTIFDSINGQYSYSEIAAIHNGTLPNHWRTGKIGNIINIVDDVTIVSGVLRLEITNNHTDTITVSVLRLATFN